MPSFPEIDMMETTAEVSVMKSTQQWDGNSASAAHRILRQNLEFVPSKKPHMPQVSSLKSKYIWLQPSKQTTPNMAQQAFAVNGASPAENGRMGESLPRPKVIIYSPDKVNMKWQHGLRVGAGLCNMGNTCFLNAIMQCITHTAPLVNYCRSDDHPRNCRQKGFCAMCVVRDHIRKVLQLSGKTFKPKDIVFKIRQIGNQFRFGRQEDAHEFLRHLIDGMQKSCLNGLSQLDHYSKGTTAIHQIFGGFLRSQVQCMNCSAFSNSYEPFMDLSLDIHGIHSLQGALAKFSKTEYLSGENNYACDRCKRKSEAKKRFTLHKVPNVLTVQLNRFNFGLSLRKITTKVQFPERLDIRPYMSTSVGTPVIFQLYGVVVHAGYHCTMGHYYAYVKSPAQEWFRMNDAMVQKVSREYVHQAEAYLLFYSRDKPTHPHPSCSASLNASSHNGHTPSSGLHKVQNPKSLVKHSPSKGVLTPQHSAVKSTSVLPSSLGQPAPARLLQPIENVQQTHKQESTDRNGLSRPRIVMRIKKGKVTTFEMSGEGSRKLTIEPQNVNHVLHSKDMKVCRKRKAEESMKEHKKFKADGSVKEHKKFKADGSVKEHKKFKADESVKEQRKLQHTVNENSFRKQTAPFSPQISSSSQGREHNGFPAQHQTSDSGKTDTSDTRRWVHAVVTENTVSATTALSVQTEASDSVSVSPRPWSNVRSSSGEWNVKERFAYEMQPS